MSPCSTNPSLNELELPHEFEDIEAFVRADLKAVVKALAQRANERLLLTKREHRDLQVRLWNRLTKVVNETMEPLSAENR